MRRLLLAWLVVWGCLTGAATATPAPGDFQLVYEYDSGQKVPHPYRYRVTLLKGSGTFTRWDANGERTRESPFKLTAQDVENFYDVAVANHYFSLTGGLHAAILDSPSQWITLTADHRSLTVWAQASGNKTPPALEALASRVRTMLQERVYDWQSMPDSAVLSPLTSTILPLTVDAERGEAGRVHLGDPAEAVEATWGQGSGAVSAHRGAATLTDYYDPGEPNNSLLTVVYANGRAGELRLNLLTPSGRGFRGTVEAYLNARLHVSCDSTTTPAQVMTALGTPGADTVTPDKGQSGTIEYGRLGFYFYQQKLRYVRLAGTMENVAQGLPGDMPSDFQVTWWKRYSKEEMAGGSPSGVSVEMSLRGGVRTTVDRTNHSEQDGFGVDAAELRNFYRLLLHASFYTLPKTYPAAMPDTSLAVHEGDEGVLVWSRLGVYRVDVLGFAGHEAAPPALTQILGVAARMGKGHVIPH